MSTDTPTTPAETLDDATLAAIEARAEAATPDPWHAGGNGPLGRVIEPHELVLSGQLPLIELPTAADAEFIAHARADIPKLLAEVRRARGEVESQDYWYRQLRDVMRERNEAHARVAELEAELDRVRAQVPELDLDTLHQHDDGTVHDYRDDTPCWAGGRSYSPQVLAELAAIDNALRNGSYMTGANLALNQLCDRIGVDRDRLSFDPLWARRPLPAETEGDHG